MNTLERIEKAEEELRLAKLELANDIHTGIKKFIEGLPQLYTTHEYFTDYGDEGRIDYIRMTSQGDNIHLGNFLVHTLPDCGYSICRLLSIDNCRVQITLRKL